MMKLLPLFGLLLVSDFLHARPGVETSLSYLNYHETSAAGDLLNRESGWLPQVRFLWDVDLGNQGAELNATYLGGSVNYRGQTQGGLTHQTDTDQDIFSIAGQWRWSYSAHMAFILGGQHYWWRRDIRPAGAVSGLTEDYAWYLLEAGLTGQSNGWQGLVSWNRTMFASMVIQPTSCTDRVELSPKPANGFSLRLSRQVHPDWRFSIGHRLMRMAASELAAGGSCTGTIYWREPDNQMQISHIGISIGF